LFRFGYDYPGGYERGMGGRLGFTDEKSHGRFMNRSAGAYQNGPSGMYVFGFALRLHAWKLLDDNCMLM
jgi:hypothetical protein